MLDWDRVKARANGDGEFRIHARLWTSRIRLNRGAEKTCVEIVDGAIASIEPMPGGRPSDLSISAPAEDWDALLAKVPRPFYQDLHPAAIHHGFEINGDHENYCAYYPAVRRLIEILREVNNA